MRNTFFSRAIVSGVALFVLTMFSACVNEKYELSRENIDLNVTVFQEGVCLPLGKTDEITIESLYSQLEEGEITAMIKVLDNAYMFHMADTLDMTDDISGVLSGIGGIEALSMDSKFEVDLSSVDLSSLDIQIDPVRPDPIDVSGMLNVPDLDSYMPTISTAIPTITASIPKPDVEGLEIDLSSIKEDTATETTIVSLDGLISDELLANPLVDPDLEHDYAELQTTLAKLGITLPGMVESLVFEEYILEVPVSISLPKEIKEVRSIELHPDAAFKLAFEIVNPLFTSGAIIPSLDVELHDLMHIDRIESGIEDGAQFDDSQDTDGDGLFERHILDNFIMGPSEDDADNWRAEHVYHVDSLMISKDDWTVTDDALVLDKVFKVRMSGELKKDGLMTTLRHLNTYGSEPMKIKMDVEFINMEIENVKMVINPIKVSENLEVPVEIAPVELPELVKAVEYVDFDDSRTLDISMKASVPDICSSLDISLKTLKIEFPEGMVIDRPQGSLGTFDADSRTLTYENVSLTEGLEDHVVIDRMNLPAMTDGTLSYSGMVKVTAEAEADGVLDSKEVLQGEAGDITVDVTVDYAPALTDYSVVIDDYPYDVDIDEIKIEEPLDKEVGEMLAEKAVVVSLKEDVPGQNQKIEIRLIYPEHDAVKILPKEGEGLKIDFPDMLKFASSSILPSYNFNAEDNTINFTGETEIPREIVLEIEKIEVKAVKSGEDYMIQDRLNVTGGVRLLGTTIHKQDVDELMNMGAKVEFEAIIPRLSPARLGLDEYEITIDENISIDKIEVEIPETVKTISMEELLLKDVYLDLTVDASSIRDVAGDVGMDMLLEVTLPKMLVIENKNENVSVSNDNVLKLNTSLDKDGKMSVGGVRVVGFDLSDVAVADGKLTVDKQDIPVKGSVKLNDISIDVETLEGKKIEVSVAGSLATRTADGAASEEIEIEKIVGHVGFDIEPVEMAIDLSSLAETLNGDNMSAVVDINAYWLTLDVNTNIDVPVKGSLEVTPWYGNEAGEKVSRTLELDPAEREDGTYRLFVSNMDPNATETGDRYEVYKGHEYISLDLLSMLYKEGGDKPVMVDSVQIALVAGVDSEKTCVIEPSKDYVLNVEYEVGVPMEFGEDFSFEYRDTLSGLPEIVNQLLEYGSIGLGGKITNSLPLRLDVQVNLLDSLDKVIPMKDGAGILKVASCDAKGDARTTDINLFIGVADTPEVGIKAVELVFRADAADAAGVPLRPDSFVQAELNAMIPEGVTLDGWEFIDKSMNDDEN